jgi:uncharacterized protein YbjQ (UPF0145 family)
MFDTVEEGERAMLMTTTEAIPGFQVEQVLGLVEASSGWAVGVARNRLVKKAERMGANAILATRYASGTGSLSGTICYGTAVVVRSRPG